MKAANSAIVSLALVAQSFAIPNVVTRQEQSNVLVDVDAFFPNRPGNGQANFEVTLGTCFNVPADFNNRISAIAVNGGTSCLLFDLPSCTGATPPGPNGLPVTGRVNDLAGDPYFFDDTITSMLCTRA
ncbi:hypothetical protein CC78DRAFT_567595 [Lojkania enalia]|uniref:Uncharacterized protein n=1 Tax=Lojkania enalia TaxID=147567 RepID=A0A9P4KBF4_9PLEO|nr:hypothetical protein CC78DRAFT_567595 [Didymosphaeria enalia]